MYARVCDRIREIGKGSCGGYGLCPLLKHVFFSLSLFWLCHENEICADDVFLPQRRGQISEEHYRWLIMNDRLIKLI